MESLQLKVDGMSCGSCVNTVTKALTALPGVSSVGVSLADGMAHVEGTGLSLPAIEAAIAAAGYEARVPDQATATPAMRSTPARAGGCGSGSGSGKAGGGCCCG